VRAIGLLLLLLQRGVDGVGAQCSCVYRNIVTLCLLHSPTMNVIGAVDRD